MQKINLSIRNYLSLVNNSIPLDIIFFIELAMKDIDIVSIKETRVQLILKSAERKGYIKDGIVTESGRELYRSLLSEDEEIRIKKVENKDKEWEEFLSYYPPNNRFIWKGREFAGDRGIKNNTKDGKEIFTNILNNSSISSEDLWKAVVAEALAKMKESYKTGENKMKYFINTTSWLRQQRYLNFLSEGKALENEEISAYKEAYNRNKNKGNEPKKSIDI